MDSTAIITGLSMPGVSFWEKCDAWFLTLIHCRNQAKGASLAASGWKIRIITSCVLTERMVAHRWSATILISTAGALTRGKISGSPRLSTARKAASATRRQRILDTRRFVPKQEFGAITLAIRGKN